MRRTICFAVLAILVAIGIPSFSLAQEIQSVTVTPAKTLTRSQSEIEEAKIQACFEAYKNSILNDQGEVATKYVSERTIQFYDSMAFLARTADSLHIDSLSIIDKLTVLALRARTPNELLFSYEGREVFVFAINSGMVGKDDVRNNDIGKIYLDSTFARAMMMVNGTEAPLAMHFHLEEGEWKMDLTSLFPITNTALEEVIEDSEMTENEFLEFVIAYGLKGQQPFHELWEIPSQQ